MSCCNGQVSSRHSSCESSPHERKKLITCTSKTNCVDVFFFLKNKGLGAKNEVMTCENGPMKGLDEKCRR